MLRKNIRLRKEYIFNQEQSKKVREENIKKLKMKKAYEGSLGLSREQTTAHRVVQRERRLGGQALEC